MSVGGDQLYTECNAQMTENLKTLEFITNKKDAKVESSPVISVKNDQSEYSSLELDHATENLENLMSVKESVPFKSEDLNFQYSTTDSSRCMNIDGHVHFSLNPKSGIKSLPLSYLKGDMKANDILVNFAPKLKAESEASLKSDVSQLSESTLCGKRNISVDPYNSPAEGKELKFTDILPGSSCAEDTYQPASTASASQEIISKCMNPIVVLKRLSFLEIGSCQSKQDSENSRNEDCQHSQEIRNTVKRIGSRSLHGHKYFVTNTKIKLYTCKLCGKSFGRRGELTNHLIIHTGLKLYKYQECGKLFWGKGKLKSHLITHTGLKLYRCEECGKSFGSKRSLGSH